MAQQPGQRRRRGARWQRASPSQTLLADVSSLLEEPEGVAS